MKMTPFVLWQLLLLLLVSAVGALPRSSNHSGPAGSSVTSSLAGFEGTCVNAGDGNPPAVTWDRPTVRHSDAPR